MASRDLLVVLTLVTVMAGCLPLAMSESLPGLQMLISKKGLDYTNTVALKALSTEMKDLKIPDQSGKSEHLEWTLRRIVNRGVTVPSSAMNFDPSHNGLTWTIAGLGINLHAQHWRAKYTKGWFTTSTSGSVDVNVKRVSLRVTLSLDQSGGRPSVFMSRCHATIGDVDVYFHGGISFILNLFRGMIGDKIKDVVQGEICKAARKLVNSDLNRELAHLKVNVALGKKFLLDYSLVSAPKVKATSLEMKNKGEIYWKADVEESPFSPKPLPELTDESHMMYLWVSEYVANSAFHHAHSHEFLQYNLTDRDFLSDDSSFMDTSCSFLCMGNLIPILGMQYPDSKVIASVTAVDTPILSISRQGISFQGNARMDLHITAGNDTVYNVINFDLTMFLTVTGSVLHERLAGEITQHRVEVKDIRSIIGDIDSDVLNSMLKAALDLGVIPGLNAVMREGIDLPVTQVLSFKDTQLSLHDGSVLIATDVTAFTSPPTQEEIRKELQLRKQKQQQKQLALLKHKQKEQQRKRQEEEMKTELPLMETELQPVETELPHVETELPPVETELPSVVTSKLPTEQQTKQTVPLSILVTTNPPKSSEQEQHLHKTDQPTDEQKTSTQDLETTAQPSGTEQSGQGQGDKAKSAHRAYCDRVMNFCLSSQDFCT